MPARIADRSRPRAPTRRLAALGAAIAAAALACAAPACAAKPAAPAPAAPQAVPAARPGGPDAARIIAEQIRRERARDLTGQLSKGFKAAYDAVPKDDDNVGPSVLATLYDRPDKVVRVGAPRYEPDAPDRASVRATLHYTNEDAPVRAFDRDITVYLVREDGAWKIDDVGEAATGKAPEVRMRDRYASVTPGPEYRNPDCIPLGGDEPRGDRQAMAAGFSPLTNLRTHPGDPNLPIIKERFAAAVGSACPVAFELTDLNGDGLADLVLQFLDRKLGATDAGLRRTAVYVLDRQGRWQPSLDGLASSVLARTDRSGTREVALADGTGYRTWRWTGAAFAPVPDAGR